MTKAPITLESHMQYFRDKVLTGKNIQFIVERIEENTGLVSYPIATIYLKDVDNENHCCELCVFTSSDVEWDTEGQIQATKMILDKAFKEYGMHKVYARTFYNEGIEMLKSAGFTLEAVLKSEVIINGEYKDIYRLSIFNPQENK
jgi:RimJ/RimL family protein N-acetyltransferase